MKPVDSPDQELSKTVPLDPIGVREAEIRAFEIAAAKSKKRGVPRRKHQV